MKRYIYQYMAVCGYSCGGIPTFHVPNIAYDRLGVLSSAYCFIVIRGLNEFFKDSRRTRVSGRPIITTFLMEAPETLCVIEYISNLYIVGRVLINFKCINICAHVKRKIPICVEKLFSCKCMRIYMVLK